MAYPAVSREGSVYHQGGLVALVHRFSSFLFLRQSLSVARESPAPESMLFHFTFRGPAHRVISKNPIAIGGCLSLHWQVWSDEGAEPWVVEVLQWGYQISFRWALTLSRDPIPLPAYASSSIRDKALEGDVQALLTKGALGWLRFHLQAFTAGYSWL